MRNNLLAALVCAFVFTGCKHTSSIYERDDLITVAYNSNSDYTLLVYQSASGRIRKVLRRKGVCELLLIETEEGEFLLKERGHEPKKLPISNVSAVEAHLEELIYNKKGPDTEVPSGGSSP